MTITIPGDQQTNRDRQGADGRVVAAQPAPAAPPAPAQQPAPPPAQVASPAPVEAAASPPANPYAPVTAPPLQSGLEAPPAPEAGTWDVMAAAWRRDTILGDVAGFADRQRQGLAMDMFYALPASAQRRIAMNPLDYASGKTRFEQLVMDEAARYAAQNPAGWGDLPLTREQFDARLLNADQAALDEANAILAQPGGGIAEFTGAVARDFTRPANLALMPLGGAATSLLKFVATEAALSGVSSVAALPGQYAAAERLDLPDPNAAQQVAVDTAIGGAFAGVLGGIVKGLGWAYARTAGTRAAMPEGANPTQFEANVAAAEGLLTGNRTVQEETRAAVAPAPLTLPPGDVPYNEAAVLRAIIGVESGGNARAQNPNSSARGLGQFISSTWLNMIRKYRPDLAEGRSANEVLALRDDPTINAEMTAMYTRENYAFLQSQGLPTNPGELYLAHFMGPGGAASALRAPLDTPITSIMSQDAIAANAGIRFGGKRFAEFTAGDLRRWAAHKMRSAYDPNASADMPVFADSGTSRGYTQSGQVSAGDGLTVDVDYEVVDYSSLIRASGDLQPRDRSQINSDDWVASTAARLDPAQLMPSPNAATGTPIIGSDNVILSGNGRSLAIARAYERAPDRAAAYRQAIIDRGYPIPAGVERPVLVAKLRTPLTAEQLKRFVVDAQDSGVAVMTPAEMARATARNLNTAVLSRIDLTQPINSPANSDFTRAALSTLSRAARNALYDTTTGALNASGLRQLREALFARAWPDPGILRLYTEGTAKDLKALMEALEEAAPNWASLRADIEAGLVVPELDISPFILDAMRLIAAAREVSRRDGLNVSTVVAEMLDKVDMLEGAVSPLTVALVRKFWSNGRAAPADQVSAFLARYADEARQAGKAGGMFDPPTPQDVLRTVDNAAFGDLPENLGRARGFATPTPAAARLADDAFTAGAASPEAEAAGAEIAESLSVVTAAAENDLMTLVQSGASFDDIAAHPKVAAAIADMASRPLTTDLPGYGTEEFWATREYRAGERVLAGREAAWDYLYAAARDLAWTDEGLAVPANAIRQERTATILLGPPAAGKSTIANPLARQMGAAIIDADEAKKLIPEYERGIGANAVHEESSELIDEVLTRAVIAGENMVLPKVGGSAASIEFLAEKLARNGYKVNLVLADVPGDVAMQRMIGRFSATGRIIPLDIMKKGIDGAAVTYQTLKTRSFINAYSHIDNTPGLGQPRGIIEDPAEIIPADLRGNGADRNGQPGSGIQEARPETLTRAGNADQTANQGLTPTADPEMDQAAAARFDAQSAIIAARADTGDFDIEMPDGTTMRASDVLDDLARDADTDFQITFCTTNGGTA